jgi:hypothetical protein
LTQSGAIFPDDTIIQTDKNFDIAGPDGRLITSIVGVPEVESVCTFINDCVSIHNQYSDVELISFELKQRDIPLLPGYAHNSLPSRHGAKLFVMASRAIAQDEEIFFAYGR